MAVDGSSGTAAASQGRKRGNAEKPSPDVGSAREGGDEREGGSAEMALAASSSRGINYRDSRGLRLGNELTRSGGGDDEKMDTGEGGPHRHRLLGQGRQHRASRPQAVGWGSGSGGPAATAALGLPVWLGKWNKISTPSGRWGWRSG